VSDWFQLAQLGFALIVGLLVAERVRALYLRAASSDEAQRWLVAALEAGELDGPRRWVETRPEAHSARVLHAVLDRAEGVDAVDGKDDLGEVLVDLRADTLARLKLLRVSATLASTLGLLGGILTLARGSADRRDLLALSAGAAQRATLDEAITSMAIGVATSAFCFQAVSLLRRRAQRQLVETARLARVAEALAARPRGP